MKRALFASVVALICACGSSGTNGNGGNGTGGNGGGSGTTGGGTDMSASAGHDAAMSLPPDMQPAYGCNALSNCLDACTDQASCTLCIASSTSQAKMLYQAASRCVRALCYPHPDGGPAPCTQGGGTPSADCTTCQDDSIKMQGSCGSDTNYCGKCYTQYAACLADKP